MTSAAPKKPEKRGDKRDAEKMDTFEFAEDEELHKILSHLPPSVQSHANQLFDDVERATWVNGYLNKLLFSLPKLQQAQVKAEKSNSGMFWKLNSFLRATEGQEVDGSDGGRKKSKT